MKKLLSVVALAMVLGAATFTGVFAATRLAGPQPVQGNKLGLVISADTVTGSPTGGLGLCYENNYFKPGDTVVFRMWATDVADGGYAVTPTTAAKYYPEIKIAGEPNADFSWASEPRGAPTVSYWEYAWTVPAKYPVGTVPFKILVKTLKTQKYKSLTATVSAIGVHSTLQIT